MDSSKSLEQIVARAGQLYSLPAAAMRVLDLTRDPHLDIKALRSCLENDPAIASRVLRVVNSSMFAPTREVTDLGQALTLLGIHPLKLLVLGFSLPSGLFLEMETKALVWYWRHALTKAVAARALSRQFWRIPGDEAFLSGLFQDLGALVLFQQLGQPYARFIDRALSYKGDVLALEKKAFGFTHVDISARLLKRWGMPESLIDIVSFQPPQACETAMHQINCLSEWIARLLVDGQTGALDELLALGSVYCGSLHKHLEALVADVDSQVKELADILALELPDGIEYRDILADAQRQLSKITTQVAADLLRAGRPIRHEAQDDWFVDDFDSLKRAMAAACKLSQEEALTIDAIVAQPAVASANIALLPAATDSFVAGKSSLGLIEAAPLAAELALANSALAVAEKPKSSQLLNRLTPIIAQCRTSSRPVSLLLLEIGNPSELKAVCGLQYLANMGDRITGLCERIEYPGKVTLKFKDHGFALIFPGAERRQALEYGNELSSGLRRLCAQADPDAALMKVGIGIATVSSPTRNFPPRNLLEGADRCLYASLAAGCSVVKSIEIY